ncbi:T9SS type A sorting domain-containing protein [candidate division WOR-3 bacterium]|nr:T9SS type A sorting domain-containing protein [candidate division WOR-3 bacterium]
MAFELLMFPTPHFLNEVGFYDTPGSAAAVYVIADYAYAADSWTGLQIYRYVPEGGFWTDDPLALAYNGNRHFVRKPNSGELHLVYTDQDGIIYRYSSDGGINWDEPKILGAGEFPAICFDLEWNPCVTWTDGTDLYFARRGPGSGWLQTTYPFTALPSHPSIAVIPSDAEPYPDTVHIIFRLLDNASLNSISELYFPITNPLNYRTRTVEASSGANMIVLDFPSVVRDFRNTLHATWMHGDTIWYGTRARRQANWNVWGDAFDPEGHQSAHPFVETYGDSIFVVWQNEADEEVYRGARHLQNITFPNWDNLSQTPAIPFVYPVNASGLVTTFVDKSSPTSEYDIFWKTYPGQPLHNLSNTPSVRSIFPHISLRITEDPSTQYTVWLEGNEAPYEIKCARTTINPALPPAYFTSIAGFEIPSMHLVARDSFISAWQIPVDVGYESVAYQFPLEPDYRYKLRAIAYHQNPDKWKIKVMIDEEEIGEIEYYGYEPETLELWIPEGFYADSVIDVIFECDDGDFASIGPIFIYRYEYGSGGGGQGGGPMAQQGQSLERGAITFSPNPFITTLSIRFQGQVGARFSIKAYDVAGRLVKNIYEGMINSSRVVRWCGDDEKGRTASQGIYFLRIENLETKESIIQKALRVE